MRILYFGMDGAFSYPPLFAMLKAVRTGQLPGHEITAVILPASAAPNFILEAPFSLLPPERPQSDLPLVQPYLTENIIHLAWANHIPVYLVRNMRDSAVQSLLHILQPDVACAACFPFLIPKEILSIPPHGFLNIHPSLLPHYRGPVPLFWIFRNGDQEHSGVTLHWMDEKMDTGDILSQRPISLPDGITGPEADHLCAAVGAELVIEGLEQLMSGQAPRRPQTQGGSYQSQPSAADFTLERHWTAQRAFNFMRGTAEWNYPYTVQTGSQTLTLTTADSYNPNQILPNPFRKEDGRYLIQFTPGTLAAY